MRHGDKINNLGRTASEIKTTIGATPIELTCRILKFLNVLELTRHGCISQ